ncbi:MAG: nucleoside hydrolase [Alphaproteobacteria bacterium]|nr:nucleoside hydrolase [Alphaproteobacteria bacterium]
MSRPKLLIDCDPGHDDAVAILYAARHCELIGLTTVAGNQTIEHTTRNALAICELAGIDVPVARGAERPLVQAAIHAGNVHGATGIDGADLPAPRRDVVGTHAVELLIETARAHRDELVVAVLGPQTNVALALRREPRLASWVREFSVMGGSTDRGNATPAAEFNIYADPEAAAVLFASEARIRMVGLNVTRQTGFDRAGIAALAASGRRVAATAAGFLAFYLERRRALGSEPLAAMHDVCAVIPHVRDGMLGYRDAAVAVELAGTHTRGMTVCDLRGGPVQVAMSAERETLIADVAATILSYD